MMTKDEAKILLGALQMLEGLIKPEDEVSIEHVARNIAKNFNYEHRLVFDSSYSDGQYKKTAN